MNGPMIRIFDIFLSSLDKMFSQKYKEHNIRYIIGISSILGILQIIYIFLCFRLFKIKSWKWISEPINPLDDKLKKVHLIYQREEALFLITFSFLGIWILMSESVDLNPDFN